VFVLRSNKQKGTSEIWRAFASSALSNVNVTATLSHGLASFITVVNLAVWTRRARTVREPAGRRRAPTGIRRANGEAICCNMGTGQVLISPIPHTHTLKGEDSDETGFGPVSSVVSPTTAQLQRRTTKRLYSWAARLIAPFWGRRSL